MLHHHVVDVFLFVAQGSQYGRGDAFHEVADEPRRHLSGLHGGLGSRHGSAAVVAKDDDQWNTKLSNAV